MSEIKIGKVDERKFLQIGAELIEITDYNLISSADGSTELTVTIGGWASTLELSANLEAQM